MKACGNCGGKHPDHWWEVIREWWNDATVLELPDLERLAFATGIYWLRPWFPARTRRWWGRLFVEIRVKRSMRRTAQSDLIIQLKFDDPRVAGLMNFMASGQAERVN